MKEIDSPEQKTYVYGFAEIDGASKFQINLKNVETNKRYTFTKKWLSVPFMTKEILFAFQVDPGKWRLESVIATKGGQTVIPTGPQYTFEVFEGKGNYMGRIKTTINPFAPIFNAENNLSAENKTEIDEKMGGEFPNFDASSTVLIGFNQD